MRLICLNLGVYAARGRTFAERVLGATVARNPTSFRARAKKLRLIELTALFSEAKRRNVAGNHFDHFRPDFGPYAVGGLRTGREIEALMQNRQSGPGRAQSVAKRTFKARS